MPSELWADMVAERCTNEGPTGEHVEVLEVAVMDYGGNEHGRATSRAEAIRIKQSLRIPTRFRAVRTGQAAAGGDLYCGFCD